MCILSRSPTRLFPDQDPKDFSDAIMLLDGYMFFNKVNQHYDDINSASLCAFSQLMPTFVQYMYFPLLILYQF